MDVQHPKKKPPTVAIVAIVVPLLVIVVAAVVTSTSTAKQQASATTIAQDGDLDAQAREAGTQAGSKRSSGPGSESKTDARTSNLTKPGTYDEIATKPADAGAEGDRTTVTYPQPSVPAGGCSAVSGTAVITLGKGPSPACLRLAADQRVVVRNRTGKEISFVAIGLNEIIAAGSEARVGAAGSAFGDGQSTFWSPGNPQLSGIVQVR